MKFLAQCRWYVVLLAVILIGGLLVRLSIKVPPVEPEIPAASAATPDNTPKAGALVASADAPTERSEVVGADPQPARPPVRARPDTLVLLSGRVVDAQGHPVAGADLELEVIPDFVVEEEEDRPGARQRTQSRKDGRFWFGGEALAEHYRLTASAPGLQRVTRTHRAGRTDVEVCLGAGALVAGTLLIDPDIPVARLRAVVQSGKRRFRLPLTGSDGLYTFRANHLPPGRASFYLRSHFDRGIFRIEGFTLTAGMDSTPGGLRPLDLRGAMHHFRIRTLGPTGEALTARVIYNGSTDGWITMKSAAPIFVVAKNILSNLTVEADGYRPAHIARLDSDQEIRLQKGLPVRIEVDPAVARWYGMFLWVEFQPERAFICGGSVPDTRSTFRQFGEDGTAQACLAYPGEYKVRFSFTGYAGKPRRRPEVGATTIHLRDDPNLQVFRPAMDSEALNREARRNENQRRR
ncbi:MAG: carboxypeptidase-like regulatory domain-containing protein [Planctomycetota bacterium]|jgi:hypothetical protein